MAKKDGGPAFPTGEYTDESDRDGLVEGMSLRDYFAARAMGELLGVGAVVGREDFDDVLGGMAKAAYRVADEMLKERDRG